MNISFEVLLALIAVVESVSSAYAAFRSTRKQVWLALLILGSAAAFAILCFAGIYTRIGLNESGQVTHDYTTAIYFSLVTFTTIGYGDVTPLVNERVYCAIEVLFGYIYLGLLLSIVINTVLPQDKAPSADPNSSSTEIKTKTFTKQKPQKRKGRSRKRHRSQRVAPPPNNSLGKAP